ncbi:unnamed protein product [Allacma fusca]|uniref:Disease resistance R13L4/SHOC-2-like LRR domain-containing protein n=1 Tax=Allacma fusca TaxID=39272 RepID=A0A8J2P6W1_9HEXA|nr:unnamed protein product [Allacma fusca]
MKKGIVGKSSDSSITIPKKPSGVRAFLQANRNRIPKRSSPVFHDAPPTNDLSANVVKSARKSGSLNLSSRNLTTVPPKVWRINDLDENEKSSVSVSLDNPSEEKWWEFVDLQKLILANNSIMEIPSDLGNLISLQTFDAHDNQIERVANEISNLENLQKLNLSHNKILFVPSGLYKLKRLTELRLSHNKIDELSNDIGNLSCLNFMDVSNNGLKKIPEDIGYLSFLTSLNISNNKIKELPADIGGLTGLRTLDASDNCLVKMPDTLSELIHLEILYLRKNRLTKIPDVSKCGILKEIYLQNNLIASFDSKVFSMTKIQLLDFRTNKIKYLEISKDHLEFVDRFYLDNNDIGVLPDDLAMLPSLKSLTLDGNPLRGIRIDILQRGTSELLKYLRSRARANESGDEHHSFNDGFGDANSRHSSMSTESSPRDTSSSTTLCLDPHKLKATRLLNISSRGIKVIEDDIFEIAGTAQVTNVDLSRNQLATLPQSITNVEEFINELKLDGNKLTALPTCIGRFSRLQFLSFQGNQIVELPVEFGKLQNLREINLSYNRIQTFPTCLYEMKRLEIVFAADNKMTTLDVANLLEMKNLTVLDVRNNNISQLPPELGTMTQLKSLNVEGNAFRVPGYQILSQGTEAILKYLRNRIVTK